MYLIPKDLLLLDTIDLACKTFIAIVADPENYGAMYMQGKNVAPQAHCTSPKVHAAAFSDDDQLLNCG